MSAPAGSSVTLLRPGEIHPEAQGVESAYYIREAGLLCFDGARAVYTSIRCKTILSTGDPISVVFPLMEKQGPVHVVYELIDHDVPLSWCGVPCHLVRVRIGLPVLGQPTLRPFPMVALLPERLIEDTPPCLRLGVSFLYATRASVRLTTAPFAGELLIPY